MLNHPDILPRWMRLKDAAHYSAIGVHRLKDLAEAGIIKGFQDPDDGRGGWIFDRISIDKYREEQTCMSGGQAANQKAMDILRKAGLSCRP